MAYISGPGYVNGILLVFLLHQTTCATHTYSYSNRSCARRQILRILGGTEDDDVTGLIADDGAQARDDAEFIISEEGGE